MTAKVAIAYNMTEIITPITLNLTVHLTNLELADPLSVS